MTMMLDMSRLTHNSFNDLLELPFDIFKKQYSLLLKKLKEEKDAS